MTWQEYVQTPIYSWMDAVDAFNATAHSGRTHAPIRLSSCRPLLPLPLPDALLLLLLLPLQACRCPPTARPWTRRPRTTPSPAPSSTSPSTRRHVPPFSSHDVAPHESTDTGTHGSCHAMTSWNHCHSFPCLPACAPAVLPVSGHLWRAVRVGRGLQVRRPAQPHPGLKVPHAAAGRQ